MFNIVFLPVNQAWAIVFGNDLAFASVLKICTTKAECESWLWDWQH